MAELPETHKTWCERHLIVQSWQIMTNCKNPWVSKKKVQKRPPWSLCGTPRLLHFARAAPNNAAAAAAAGSVGRSVGSLELSQTTAKHWIIEECTFEAIHLYGSRAQRGIKIHPWTTKITCWTPFAANGRRGIIDGWPGLWSCKRRICWRFKFRTDQTKSGRFYTL
jgi:hypothetical protein